MLNKFTLSANLFKLTCYLAEKNYILIKSVKAPIDIVSVNSTGSPPLC